jgi:hypothetical protein
MAFRMPRTMKANGTSSGDPPIVKKYKNKPQPRLHILLKEEFS